MKKDFKPSDYSWWEYIKAYFSMFFKNGWGENVKDKILQIGFIVIGALVATGVVFVPQYKNVINNSYTEHTIGKVNKATKTGFKTGKNMPTTYNAKQAQRTKDGKYIKPQYTTNQQIPSQKDFRNAEHNVATTDASRGLIAVMNRPYRHVSALRGWISYPSKYIAQPIFEGDSEMTLLAGAGTAKKGEVMGQRNFAIVAHHISLTHMFFSNLQYMTGTGGLVYLTNGRTLYIYKINKHIEKWDDTKLSIIQDHPENDKQPIITLQTCYIPWRERYYAHPVCYYRVIEQGDLIKTEPLWKLSKVKQRILFQQAKPVQKQEQKKVRPQETLAQRLEHLVMAAILWLILFSLISTMAIHWLFIHKDYPFTEPEKWLN